MIQAYLERDPGLVAFNGGLRHREKLHVGESVDIFLLGPLVHGADLVLQAIGEEYPRGLRRGEGLLVVHIEDHLLGLPRRRRGRWLLFLSLFRTTLRTGSY